MIPCCRMMWLLRIQNAPPDFAVVPPTIAAFSSMMTLAFASVANNAATDAAAPLPAITTSAS